MQTGFSGGVGEANFRDQAKGKPSRKCNGRRKLAAQLDWVARVA